MPVPRRQRRKRKQKKERDWRQIAWYVISGLVVISMSLGFVLSYLVR